MISNNLNENNNKLNFFIEKKENLNFIKKNKEKKKFDFFSFNFYYEKKILKKNIL